MYSILLAILVALIVPYVTGQVTTNAVCTTDPWTANERGQSPCLGKFPFFPHKFCTSTDLSATVTSALQAACDGGNFNVPALSAGQIYFGPEAGFGNPCTCSTVTYSMAQACGACQGAGINKWSVWMTNCTANEISIGLYPLTIPAEITVPSWAYQNVTTIDLWNANEALATANEHQPDSSAIPQPTTSSNSPGGTTPTGSSSGKSNTNIGAIVGGVVGGVVVIVLVVVVIFFVRRKSKARATKTTSPHTQPWTPNEQEKFLQPNNSGSTPYQDYSPPLPSPGPTSVPAVPMVQPEPMPNHQFKPYNPSDPSTFPVTPMPLQGAPSTTIQPSSGSLRSFQIQPQLTPPMPGLPYNSSNPNLTTYPPNNSTTGTRPVMTATPYAAPSTRSEHTYHTSQGGHIQGPSQHLQYNVGPYVQHPQPSPGGGYTGVAEI